MNVIILKREVSFGVGRGERGEIKITGFSYIKQSSLSPTAALFPHPFSFIELL